MGRDDFYSEESGGHPSHNSVHRRLAFALSFQKQSLSVRHETQSGAERGAGANLTVSFTCSPASQVATLISSERTRISFEHGFLNTSLQRSRLAALLDSTPFSSSSLTATSWCFERKYWAESHSVEPSPYLPQRQRLQLSDPSVSTGQSNVRPGRLLSG